MEWKDFQMKIRAKAVKSVEVNEVPGDLDAHCPESGFVRELVLKMKSGAVARGKGDDLQECYDSLPGWAKVDG